MSDMLMVVYTSEAAKPIDSTFLKEILHVSHRNNARDGITGFLVANDGYFLQLLEGPEEKVDECYARILKDPRHKKVVRQGRVKIEGRTMPKWDMGLVSVDEKNVSAAGLLEIFKLGRMGQSHTDPESLLAMLRLFSKEAKILEP